MKPLLTAVAAFCLVLAVAHPENIEEVKELSQDKELTLEAEESSPQTRKERCTTCSQAGKLSFNSPNDVLQALKALPGGEVHTQQSYEECSSAKGCAGIKVKDGTVIEKFGNADSFREAAAADSGNEFSFHAAGSFAPGVFQAGIPKEGPFWWMNQNSPFKSGGANGNFENFSKSSSSYSTSGNAGAGATGIGAGLDLGANPFLNGEFSKLAGGFSAGGISGGAQIKPSNFQSSSFESSSFSSSKDVDISKNPFLNGGFQAQGGASGQNFAAQGGASQNSGFSSGSSSGNKFSSSGYTGSSPSPFTASTGGSNFNAIQSSQKASEFDFEQQNQQNIDEQFQNTGNVIAHEHSGGELQQTCAGQGYVCVHKAQCNNGVVNTNGANVLQARTKKQYCNTRTEVCCRIETSTLSGAGGLQGSLGVDSATFSGSASQGGLFSSSGQSGQSGSSSLGSSTGSGIGIQGGQRGGQGSGQSGFGSNSFESSSSFESRGTGFGASGQGQSGFGQSGQGQSGQGQSGQGQSGFGQSGFAGTSGTSFGSNTQGSTTGFGSSSQGAFGSGSNNGNAGGFTSNGGNKGVSVESSSSSFESRTSSFGQTGGQNGGRNGVQNGASGTKFGSSGSFGSTAFGASGSSNGGSSNSGSTNSGSSNSGSTNTRFGTNNNNFNTNEVVYKTTSQNNFIEEDSSSSGTEFNGIYRPGTSGLKPGVPYLPPIDNTNSGTNSVSSTVYPTPSFVTTPRPTTTTRKYVPSTQAPGYLPPVEGDQTINTETRVPGPNYNDGSIILDETRPARPKQPTGVPSISDVPAGCAAALKCTPIEFCTADGVISNTTVSLTRDQDAYRVPLTDCKDIESGRIGKCCRDPFYTDPWPTNQLGKWVQGVFGGNDGKYTGDSRGSGNSPRLQITARPPVTGSVYLNNFRPAQTTSTPNFGPTQVTSGSSVTQNSFGQKGQYEVRGQGQYNQNGIGVIGVGGQGQYTQGSQGRFEQKGQGQLVSQGQGQLVSQGQGQIVSQGQGQIVSQGQGQIVSQGFGQKSQGQLVSQGQGQLVTQGQGQIVSQGQGQYVQRGQGQVGSSGGIGVQRQGSQYSQTQKGFGQTVIQGQGESISQGFGTGVRQGGGFAVRGGEEYSESRVFLQQYGSGGKCGITNGQKPFGNRNELEVDFAEIPWQAMILLQTNKSLLCGGIITRPDVVITTASCLDGLLAKNVLIKGGEWKLGVDDEPLPFQIVQVKNILRHPFYKAGQLQNDAAILVLAENLRFAKNIYPICLPGARETLDAYYNGAGECIVTGWGKQVLQAHIAGAIMHSLNVSLINPGECQSKLSQDYPHLLDNYEQDSCVCGLPTNPVNNICRVDVGSALACTTGDGHFVLRGIYSWDSGCQVGNQLAAFFKFDLEWYEWAIGLIESARFAQFSSGSQTSGQKFSGQINSGGVKGGLTSGVTSGVKGSFAQSQSSFGQSQFGQSQFGQSQGSGQSQFGGQNQFGVGIGQGQFGARGQLGIGQFGVQGQLGSGQNQFSSGQFSQKFSSQDLKAVAPISNSFSASFSEKKVFQSEPQIITYTTKPEIVTFTTKPEYFTYTTKPKIVTYTTKPQIITYETSGSGLSPQYVAPSAVSFNPSFTDVASGHTHNAQCKCLENGKK